MSELFEFDATQYEPDVGREPIKAGTYTVMVKDTEKKEIGKGGHMLLVTYEVMEGEMAGANFALGYNVGGTNEDNVRIARGQLSAVCHATGVFMLNSPDGTDRNAGATLRNAQLKMAVTSDGKYNNQQKVWDMNGNSPTKGGASLNAPAQPVAAVAPTPQQQPQQGNFQQPQQAAAPVPQPQGGAPVPQPAFNGQQPQQAAPQQQGIPQAQPQQAPQQATWNQAPTPQPAGGTWNQA